MEQFISTQILALWGAGLSTILAGIKVHELWSNRFRVNTRCNFTSDPNEGSQINYATTEPRDEIKGMVARTYFYMHDRYNLRMSDQQRRLMQAWDKQFPVSAWERERDKRITERMGHENPHISNKME